MRRLFRILLLMRYIRITLRTLNYGNYGLVPRRKSSLSMQLSERTLQGMASMGIPQKQNTLNSKPRTPILKPQNLD